MKRATKQVLFAAVGLAAFAFVAPAQAQWTGPYVGVHIGSGWSHQNVSIDGPTAISFNQFPGSSTLTDSALLGGFHVGVNFPLPPSWIWGVEGDFTATGLNDSASFPNLFANGAPVGSGIITWTNDVKWLASARFRLGVTTPSVLWYVTAGAAINRTNYTGFDAYIGGCPNCGATAFSKTTGGWVVGAGLEYALTPHWSLRSEYLYYQFHGTSQSATFQSAPGLVAAIFNYGQLEIHTFRVGLTFR